ncbi:hypothetical protein Jiend_25370 [Micromonospora endophytica]|nr:hypothetical protein Jiend_25370 [Micromonospora endophytica]
MGLGIPGKVDPVGWGGPDRVTSVPGMTTAAPTHLAQAMRRRRYPLTGWPWRALAYLLTSVPLAGVLSLGPLVVLAPLFAATSAARQGRPVSLPLTVFLTVGALTVLALAPLLAVPVAAFERYRLGLVDDRPLPRRPGAGSSPATPRGRPGGRRRTCSSSALWCPPCTGCSFCS